MAGILLSNGLWRARGSTWCLTFSCCFKENVLKESSLRAPGFQYCLGYSQKHLLWSLNEFRLQNLKKLGTSAIEGDPGIRMWTSLDSKQSPWWLWRGYLRLIRVGTKRFWLWPWITQHSLSSDWVGRSSGSSSSNDSRSSKPSCVVMLTSFDRLKLWSLTSTWCVKTDSLPRIIQASLLLILAPLLFTPLRSRSSLTWTTITTTNTRCYHLFPWCKFTNVNESQTPLMPADMSILNHLEKNTEHEWRTFDPCLL